MWKVWVIPSLCDNCLGKVKKCEEFIPWLTSQNEQSLYINTNRASVDELIAAAEQAMSNCPVYAIKMRRDHELEDKQNDV